MARRDVTPPGGGLRAEGGGRGRRDPALRQRMQQDQPVYDDEETPDGVVGVRPRDDVDEGDDGAPFDPAELLDEGEDGMLPDHMPLLLEGDVIIAKVTHAVRFDEDASFFSYGTIARVQEGEEEEDAFDRISTIVNTRSLDLAYAAEDHVNDLLDRVEKRRRERADKTSGRALRPRAES